MNITVAEVVTWLIVGGLAGSLIGMIVNRKKEGFGVWINLGIGLVGAIIGGLLFNLLNIDYGMSDISVSLQDLVSAAVGSLIFLLTIWIVRKVQASKKSGESA